MKGKNYETFFEKKNSNDLYAFQYFEIVSMKIDVLSAGKAISGITVKQRIRICIIKPKQNFT